MTGVSEFQDEAKIRVPPAVYGSLRLLAHGINRAYWRVSIEGAAVPSAGPVILAPVHRSFIDFFVVSEVTRRPIFYMTKEEMWNSRLLGKFLDATGAFPVRREGVDRRSLSYAQKVLEHGEALVLFPEGTRRSGTQIAHLHEGTAFLASRTGARIVPIGIGGTERSLPLGSKFPRPVSVTLVVGEPLAAEVQQRERATRHQLRDTTEQLRSSLQLLYDEAREKAAV